MISFGFGQLNPILSSFTFQSDDSSQLVYICWVVEKFFCFVFVKKRVTKSKVQQPPFLHAVCFNLIEIATHNCKKPNVSI